MILNILSKFLVPFFQKADALLSGKKTYLAGLVIMLPAIACMIDFLISKPLSMDRLMALFQSDCVKQFGEGLAVMGFRSAIKKPI